MATYREAGVDIQRGDGFVKRIGPMVRSTSRPEVMGDIGGFVCFFRFRSDRYREPILVAGTDGLESSAPSNTVSYITVFRRVISLNLFSSGVGQSAGKKQRSKFGLQSGLGKPEDWGVMLPPCFAYHMTLR
ncbi:hypothetical protein ACTRXD_19095 [Nitrospira sp. T9]|uniref:hypothetical protein n=1 Tax=unclassified Nitrospira TaxID=2652172 RepID=UPI003F9DA391